MRILYYCWDELTSADFLESTQELGYTVAVFRYPLKNKLMDVEFMNKLEQIMICDDYDCIFTFNYFPVISKFSETHNIKYVCWLFDSPNLTLYSESIFNQCNYIFSFDKSEVLQLQTYGIKNIFHMPLAVNTKKLHTLLDSHPSHPKKYSYEISFLGKLYNDEYNFFDQIKNIPEYYRGFFDALIKAQMNIFGYDIASDIITDEFFSQINSFVSFQQIDEIFLHEKDFFINILQKKITATERLELLKLISSKYKVTHFASVSDPSLDKVEFKGYVNYDSEMPFVFAQSKINLNITLRSILSGIPLRCLDIMGAGGFLLSNYQPELAEYFENGKEIVMYESQYDLMNKIDYYLSHEDEREEIARYGQRKIDEEFSYRKALPKIFGIVNADSN